VTITDFRPIADEWTIADLEELPQGVRAEVHNGTLVVMSPARLWHQQVEWHLCQLLKSAGRHAFTQVGVLRNRRDTRVAEVGVFKDQPTDPNATWHDPAALALVAEVWSPSSDAKDRNPRWYAERGIREYWLAEPIDGDDWGATITMYELATTMAGSTEYVERRRVTLDELTRTGLGS
jgi:Uma2 family endonuclease